MKAALSRLLIVAFLLLAGVEALHAQRPLPTPPSPTRWATDQAGILSQDQLRAIDQKLEAFEQRYGSQVLVYIIPTLNGAPVEEFTVRAAQEWGAGQAKYDNGLILFIFPEDRTARVEVGYGLEGAITDAFSAELIRNTMAPFFREGDWFGGIDAATDAIIAKIEHDEDPVPVSRPGSSGGIDIGTIIFMIFIAFWIMQMFGGRRRGCMPIFIPMGGGGTTWGGGGFSGGGGGGFGGFSGGGGGFGGGGATGSW